MSLYGYNFSIYGLTFFAILFLSFLYQLYFHIRYMNGVLRLRKKIAKNKVHFHEKQEPVSVIICAKNEINNLRKFLPFVLEQDYPDFEVIVVDDGSEDETEIFLNDLKKQYTNLRTTFVPVGATNLSTKKLALTLGIKAAKNEWLLFTDADCLPEDKTWIAQMARNFTSETEFVLGYGAYLQKKGFLNKLITFDALVIAMQYLGFALAGKPYMGVGRNMAYRKEVFTRQNGFASNLHVRSGDDDLMVNHAAKKRKTRIEIAPESVTWSEPKKIFRNWYYQKERHLSVSAYYKPVSKFRLSIEPVARGVFYLTLLFSLIFGNLITILASVLIYLIRYIILLLEVNRTSKHFGGIRYVFSIFLFDIFLPLVNMYILIFGKMGSKSNNIKWK